MPEEFLALADVARVVGISRQRVTQIIEADATFPEPAGTVSTGRIWRRADIEEWARITGRLK